MQSPCSLRFWRRWAASVRLRSLRSKGVSRALLGVLAFDALGGFALSGFAGAGEGSSLEDVFLLLLALGLAAGLVT